MQFKWQEIAESIRFEHGQQPSDRPDMIVRVFNMKVHEFIYDIREGKTFGPVLAGNNAMVFIVIAAGYAVGFICTIVVTLALFFSCVSSLHR